MPELDFSKIFGETATSKASFTNENYLNGWGYLGSTPPPYQLFDYLQSINDKKSKYLYDSINENKNNLLGHNTDERAHSGLFGKVKTELATHNTDSSAHSGLFGKVKTELATHNTDSSAHSGLFGKVKTELATHNTDSSAHTPILNAIKAISGMSAYDIAPSKTIASMIPLLGFGGIVAQRLEDNGYVKFANGFTIQWGNVSDVPKKYTCTFPTAFSVSPFAVMAMDVNMGNPLIFGIDTYSTTGFKIDGIRVSGTTNLWFRYIAIGV